MDNEQALLEALEARAKRREERRAFIRTTSAAAVAAASMSFLGACSDSGDNDTTVTPAPPPPPPPPPTPSADQNVLNFALNLEYLEAQFYSFAAFGTSIPGDLLTGTGTPGAIMGGRQVSFTDAAVARYAREIASDEVAHVRFLRQALGSVAVAQPAIDIGSGPNGPFSAAARAAGLIGAGQSFDPYASDENFLLGAFIFEDVGVTAYKGAAALLTNATFIEASAGILAAEAYHAGLIRTTLYAKGIAAPTLINATEAISNARDSLDGPADLDQGIAPMGGASNIVPADANGVAFSRSAGQVLNIVYLNAAAVDQGGFFPVGVNGTLQTSAANN